MWQIEKTKMSKLTVLKGLPASGKSTVAEEMLLDGNTVRLNRDLLREMLHCNRFSGKNERNTVCAEKALAEFFLKDNVNVIIDDCNLNPQNMTMWKEVADAANAKFVKREVDTDWIECVTRDNNREKSVGGDVIKNMAIQYGLIKFAHNSIVICDLDGTLCDIEHRRHFVKPTQIQMSGAGATAVYGDDPTFKKDWKSFFEGISKDKVREDVRDLIIDLYNKDKQIIFVSGRPDTYKKQTLAWLRKHNIGFAFTLIMRKSSDTRPDTEVKKQILDTYFPDKSVIYKVIDDRPSVIRMWKENNLDVIDVGDGEEF